MSVIHSYVDDARQRGYRGGYIGLRARAEWTGPEELDNEGDPVRVVACESVLAMLEQLNERTRRRGWTVLLTPLPAGDVPASVRAHLVGGRLRTPEPWPAVTRLFRATTVERRLTAGPDARRLAAQIGALAGAVRYPAAPSGVVTRDHLVAAVLSAHLDLDFDGAGISPQAVLTWCAGANRARALAGVAAVAPAVLDLVIAFIAEQIGPIAEAVVPLLRDGRPADAVPLGLLARAVSAVPPGHASRALLADRAGAPAGTELSPATVSAWADVAEQVMRDLIGRDPTLADAVLAAAEDRVGELHLTDHIDVSDVLESALERRIEAAAQRFMAAGGEGVALAHATGCDAPLVDPDQLAGVETAGQRVDAHLLSEARRDVATEVPAVRAARRLLRWLALPVPPASTMGALVARHRDADSWVDRALQDIERGVNRPALAHALRAVAAAVRVRRDEHDAAFASAIREHTSHAVDAPAGTVHLEDLMARVVRPLADKVSVLLVVCDGLSQAVGSEVVDDVSSGLGAWQEWSTLDGTRLSGIAVLPTLTTYSRTSLLSGRLAEGVAKQERANFAEFWTARSITSALFHKADLDAAVAGSMFADDIEAALDDPAVRVVGCVLNTVDDSLDKSDPGGTIWTADAIKYLRPLLDKARHAGRTVVITSDHGHVVHRDGELRSGQDVTSARSRSGSGATAGEVAVTGDRVLPNQSAILAVDSSLRYRPKRAGYHGGASPAEVLVPVTILGRGNAPTGLYGLPPQSPAWWRGATTPSAAPPPASPSPPPAQESLFAADDVPPPTTSPPAAAPAMAAAPLAASAMWKSQMKRATGPQTVTPDAVLRLVAELLNAPGRELSSESAAAALGVPAHPLALSGAMAVVQRLLNVEQYPVVRGSADNSTVILDVGLLDEQFGLSR